MLTHQVLTCDATLDGRHLTLACVPFYEPARVADPGGEPYLEQFAAGAFRKAVRSPSRTLLQREHRADIPIAQAIELREDADYLIGTWRLPETDDGDEVLEVLERDTPAGASVGFVPGDKPEDSPLIDGIVTRRYVKHLREVSLTNQPAYTGTKVLALRSVSRVAAEREYWHWQRLTATLTR